MNRNIKILSEKYSQPKSAVLKREYIITKFIQVDSTLENL